MGAHRDAERWRYSLEGLRDESPVTVGGYGAALATLRHPDEVRAREILAERADEGDAGTLGSLVDAFGRFVDNRANTPDGGEGGKL